MTSLSQRAPIAQVVACGDRLAFATSDPAFGVLTTAGSTLLRDNVQADMRGKLGEAFTVSADGSRIRIGLAQGNSNAVLFDLARAHISDAPDKLADLSVAHTQDVALTDWRDRDDPKFKGKRLALNENEKVRSLAVAPDKKRFVLGTQRGCVPTPMKVSLCGRFPLGVRLGA